MKIRPPSDRSARAGFLSWLSATYSVAWSWCHFASIFIEVPPKAGVVKVKKIGDNLGVHCIFDL
jgi:hypothetical protein